MSITSKPTIQQFYNKLQQNALLYKYQFTVRLNIPDNEISDLQEFRSFVNEIPYFVQSTSIPSVSLSNATTSYFGKDFHSPGVKQFEHNWSCNYLLQEDFELYKFFRTWQKYLSSLEKNTGGVRKLPYVNAIIDVLAEDSTTVTNSITLKGVWLKNVSEISLAYKDGGGDPVNKFKADFRYQYSFMNDIKNGKAVDGRLKADEALTK